MAGGGQPGFPSSFTADELKGGHHQVADLYARDNIPYILRKDGMLCWVAASSKMYRLVGGTENTNWVVVPYVTGDGVSKITVGVSAPSDPSVGDLWADLS